MTSKAKLEIRIWGDSDLPDDLPEEFYRHVEHVHQMLGHDFTSGDIAGEGYRGWWDISRDEDAGFKFPIGTTFLTRGKAPRLCTVADQLTTYNAAGEVVKRRYVATHPSALGVAVTDHDVVETTIAMGVQE